MSIENSKIIDAISINPNDVVVLTIADHLPWNNQHEHLMMLQSKINGYLQFIESGEIYEQYPDAKGKAYQIGIAFKFAPDKTGMEFLKKVKPILSQSGYDLYYYQLDET